MMRSQKQTKLDELYLRYNQKSFIKDDPIQFVHQYSPSKKDQEVVAFIVSTLAFGQREKMIPFIRKVLSHLNKTPFYSLLRFKINETDKLESLVYRFIKGIDIILLFYLIHTVLKEYQSLENLFKEGFEKSQTVKSAMTHFIETFHNIKVPENLTQKTKNRERNIRFLLASPKRGSACKRFHLFLRWMVRKDCVDLGLWDCIPQSALFIPLDTHVARVSKALSLTERKNPDWLMAEEITLKLKEFDPNDPVKYDFALFGYGIHNQ